MLDELHVKFTMSQGDFRTRVSRNRLLIALLPAVKCLFRQLLESLEYLHRNDIIHR